MAQEKNKISIPGRDNNKLHDHFRHWKNKGYVVLKKSGVGRNNGGLGGYQYILTDRGRDAVRWDREFKAALQTAQDKYGDMGFQRALAGDMPDLSSRKPRAERKVGKAMSAVEALVEEGYLEIDNSAEGADRPQSRGGHPRVTLTDKGVEAVTHAARLGAIASVLSSYGDDKSLEQRLADVYRQSRSSSISR